MVLCIVKNRDRLLVTKHYAAKEDQNFYRLLGGGIEFSEKGEEALIREFIEELGSSLENIHFITLLENIFEFNGRQGHEIILVFEADLVDKSIYNQKTLKILDSKFDTEASWQKIDDFKKGKLILYPKGVVDFI